MTNHELEAEKVRLDERLNLLNVKSIGRDRVIERIREIERQLEHSGKPP